MRIGRARRRNPFLRGLLVALFLPFLLAAALPAAVMPSAGGDGTVTLVLCSGDGPVEVTLDSRGNPVPAASGAGCDWAAAHPGAALAPAPVTLPRLVPASIRLSAPTPALPVLAARPAAPPARGPPLPA
ncbi:MAG: hypothetical protein N2422_05480 [Rhodobacteraceae bacterium]|nr:hypothetical protein [Paracoccaceae bacterium]